MAQINGWQFMLAAYWGDQLGLIRMHMHGLDFSQHGGWFLRRNFYCLNIQEFWAKAVRLLMI